MTPNTSVERAREARRSVRLRSAEPTWRPFYLRSSRMTAPFANTSPPHPPAALDGFAAGKQQLAVSQT